MKNGNFEKLLKRLHDHGYWVDTRFLTCKKTGDNVVSHVISKNGFLRDGVQGHSELAYVFQEREYADGMTCLDHISAESATWFEETIKRLLG